MAGTEYPRLLFMLENVRYTTFIMPDGDKLWSNVLEPHGRCIFGKWHPAQASLHEFDKDLFLLWEKDKKRWAIYIWNAFEHPPFRLMCLEGKTGIEREYGPWVIQNLLYYRKKREQKEKLGQDQYFDAIYKESDDLYEKEKLEAMEENAQDIKDTGLFDMIKRYSKGENVLGIKNTNQSVSKDYGKNFKKIKINDKRHNIDERKSKDLLA